MRSVPNASRKAPARERDGRAETDVVALDEAARVEEIARILGGIEITDAQRDAAREMLSTDRT